MIVENQILTVGFSKYGEPDFGVSCLIGKLSKDQMDILRAMTMVAIGTMEEMWRRANEDAGATERAHVEERDPALKLP